MQLLTILEKYQFSPELTRIFAASKVIELYPPQAEAIEKGVLDGKNLLMSVPTAAGKTLIAELAMLKAITQENAMCLYIAPLKALASEKFNDFKLRYEKIGINVALAVGDHDTPVKTLNQYQIIVATAEKVDSLLRTKAQWLINALNVVVFDEIHFINDNERGPTQEILTARIKQLNPKIQLIGLSATVSNAQEMADWLKAELVLSTWRPIPLKEGVFYNNRIEFEEYGIRKIAEDAKEDVSKLALDTLKGGGQVLIFVNSRRSAQAVSRQVATTVAKTLTDLERGKLALIASKIKGRPADSTQVCQKLAETIKSGSAFHHAGLKPQQRELIEKSFKENLIKVISCTPTLAAGVNLPARRAIIRDVKRYESGIGQAYIPVSEYKQCAGRAGRPQYDDYGEAVIVAKSENEASTLFDRFINAATEPVHSKLNRESALRIHILASIAGGYVHDIKGMFEFFSHTFLYHQRPSSNLLDSISELFDFLHREQFIDKSTDRFFATPLGNLTSRLYIDPISSIIIRDGLNRARSKDKLSPLGALHLITCCPDCPLIRGVSKTNVESIEMFASQFYDEFILTPENYQQIDEYYHYMSTIRTSWLLSQWIEEDREDQMCETFNIGPGDIYRHVESTQWLLYAASKIAELLNHRNQTFDLANLKTRVRYGVKEELLDLISLRGVGRVRARQLYHNGLKQMTDFKNYTIDEVGRIPQIGNNLANKIFAQLANPKISTYQKPSAKWQVEAVTSTSQQEEEWTE